MMTGLTAIKTSETTSGQQAEAEIGLPHNIEAEQALLGALLVNNDVYDRIANLVQERHFYDPVHGRIFSIAESRIQKNALASPVTLKAFMEDDPGLAELGGRRAVERVDADLDFERDAAPWLAEALDTAKRELDTTAASAAATTITKNTAI